MTTTNEKKTKNELINSFDKSLELIVINSMINYPKDIEEFLEGINPKFFEPTNQVILDALNSLKKKNHLITLETLKLALGQDFLDKREVIELLNADSIPNYLSLKPNFKEFLQLKVQHSLADKLIKCTRNSEIFDAEFLSKFIDIESNITGKLLSDWIKFYEQDAQVEKLETGIFGLDKKFEGGFEVGQLILVMGDPESGKTLFFNQILNNMTKKHKVVYLSFEFSIKKYMTNMLKYYPEIDYSRIFVDDACTDISDLRSQIKALARLGYKAFLIDSQMKIVTPMQNRTKEEQETEKFTTLSELARKLDIVIFFIVQNSKNDPMTPSGSRKGAHEAHIIFKISRLIDGDAKQIKGERRVNFRKFTIRKNKQTGEQGLIFFEMANYKFYERPDLMKGDNLERMHEEENNRFVMSLEGI
ncbi:ATPase domain-containing protein [Helicobacter cetorum]|uniref:KaiC-like domain-containing protein n=1 Tax=Helicobacter cetorum (strain ATCC BAA-429 / MIT 00-7128) TaxID=182217 RepID=I0ELK9_HELC0|nr:ATPase domain-containing protein [Helicobacter cetorum]AFI03828.1 hypothetical protein HCW_02735 [Helicobacter cetorum MIT 00-7128]